MINLSGCQQTDLCLSEHWLRLQFLKRGRRPQSVITFNQASFVRLIQSRDLQERLTIDGKECLEKNKECLEKNGVINTDDFLCSNLSNNNARITEGCA
jgi:hypothetical protein